MARLADKVRRLEASLGPPADPHGDCVCRAMDRACDDSKLTREEIQAKFDRVAAKLRELANPPPAPKLTPEAARAKAIAYLVQARADLAHWSKPNAELGYCNGCSLVEDQRRFARVQVRCAERRVE